MWDTILIQQTPLLIEILYRSAAFVSGVGLLYFAFCILQVAIFEKHQLTKPAIHAGIVCTISIIIFISMHRPYWSMHAQ